MFIKTNIVFIYADTLRRDLPVCNVISNLLISKGYRTFIFSRRNFHKALRIFLPSKLIYTGQVNILTDKIKIYNKLITNKTEIFFIPGEGYDEPSRYDIIYPTSVNYNEFSKIFFWGNNQREWFINNRAVNDQNKLVALGFLKILINKKYSQLGNKKNRIGFVGRFLLFNNIEKHLHFVDSLISDSSDKQGALLRAILEVNMYSAYGELFDFIFNETDYIISLRPHPCEDPNFYLSLKKKYKERIEIDSTYDSGSWLSKCKLVIASASSILIEAYEMDIPIVCLFQKETKILESILDIVYDISYQPESLKEIKDMIKSNNVEKIESVKFQQILDSNFTGNVKFAFKEIITSVTRKIVRKKPIMDFIWDKAIKLLDLILFVRDYTIRKERIFFDYSLFYHKVSKDLKKVTDIIKAEIID